MSNIKNLTSSDFYINKDQVYVNSNVIGNKPFMLLVHANYCGHCKLFMPDYVTLSNKTTRFNFLSIEAQDMSSKLASALKIVGYPTILFGSTKGLVAEEFDGDRSVNSLCEKIKSVCKYCI
jgi:thiol-disulfide isomerase/thioredoxin